ncbi:MAG: hypothetical protein ABIF01_03820 [Candidatus Micrarchaeota archaeon]
MKDFEEKTNRTGSRHPPERVEALKPIYAHWDDSYALEWRRSFGPPIRPTNFECVIYRQEMKAFSKDSKILMMGSTPEIRDIVSHLGLSLVVVDESEKNYSDMKGLMGCSERKETFIKKKWEEMGFDGEFDLALGDAVLSVIPSESARKVIENVNKALKTGGKWIVRVMLYSNGEDFISPDTLNGRINKCITKQEVYEQLLVPFLAYYKNEAGGVVLSEIYEKMKRDVEKGLFPKVCLDVFNALGKYEEETFLMERNLFEKSLKKMFQIEKAVDDTEPFSRHWPIYVLRKK